MDPITYRVRDSFQAIRNEPPKPFRFITITQGSIIMVKGQLQLGLVEVLYHGQIVAVFMRDIDAKADPIEGKTTGT